MDAHDTRAGTAHAVATSGASGVDDARVVHPDTPDARARHGVLALLCTGVGDRGRAAHATPLAATTLVRRYADALAGEFTDGDPQRALVTAMCAAHAAVHEVFRATAGCACTALVVRGDAAYCAHVGHARLYLARNGALFQLTEDQTAVLTAVRAGAMTGDESRWHAASGVPTGLLGQSEPIAVARWPRPFALRSGDLLLLTGADVHRMLPARVLLETLRTHRPAPACAELLRHARQAGATEGLAAVTLAIGSWVA
jgi:serine/threonine protein phosphatase PrpC